MRVSQVVLVVKNLPANAGDIRDAGSNPGRRAWQLVMESKLVLLTARKASEPEMQCWD